MGGEGNLKTEAETGARAPQAEVHLGPWRRQGDLPCSLRSRWGPADPWILGVSLWTDENKCLLCFQPRLLRHFVTEPWETNVEAGDRQSESSHPAIMKNSL